MAASHKATVEMEPSDRIAYKETLLPFLSFLDMMKFHVFVEGTKEHW